MASPQPLVALPTDDLSLTASFVMTDEDADYPASNLSNGDPAHVAKSTTNTTTITATTTAGAVVAVALINTNADTATVNAASVTLPGLDVDGQRVHGWLDRRSNPFGSTSTYTIVLSRSSGVVWVGHVALLVDLHALNLKYGATILGRRRPGDIQVITRLGSALRAGADIRTRWARGVVDLEEDETLLRNLEASARGTIHPFIFIPDEAVNDAWLVKMAAADFAMTVPNYSLREIALAFDELSGGPPNG